MSAKLVVAAVGSLALTRASLRAAASSGEAVPNLNAAGNSPSVLAPCFSEEKNPPCSVGGAAGVNNCLARDITSSSEAPVGPFISRMLPLGSRTL